VSGIESTRRVLAAEVSTQTDLVETTRQPLESENASFECSFRNPERNPFPGWNPDSRTIRSYRFSDVVLDGGFRGLRTLEGFIWDTGYLVPEDVMASLRIDDESLVPLSARDKVIVGCNHGHRNYFHWMTQALPTIDYAVHRHGQGANVCIALPQLISWQEESLRLLRYDGVRRVTLEDPAKHYLLPTAEYSEILNGGTAFALSETTRRTYARLRQSIEPPLFRDKKKIYVARTDASNRRMRNEATIIREVQRRGFEVIAPGSMTVAEQIGLFRTANLVIGSHGAGLTNIVFCDPGTIVYELLSAHYTNACFCNLAYVCGLRYWADAFDSRGEGPPFLREWDSDTRLVAERLDEIEAIHTEHQQEAALRTISAMDFLRGAPGQVMTQRTVQRGKESPRAGWLRRLQQNFAGRLKKDG
jgi:hypothetical protein